MMIMMIVLFVSKFEKDTEQMIAVLSAMKSVIPLTNECSNDKLELVEVEDMKNRPSTSWGWTRCCSLIVPGWWG